MKILYKHCLLISILLMLFASLNCKKSEDGMLGAFLALGGGPAAAVPGENGIIYVHAIIGDDTASGTMMAPVLTIAKAISLAEGAGLQRINIAEGTYAETGTLITRNVSLYGGFSAADWAVRDSVTYKTFVTDPLDVTLGASSANDTTKSLVIDGFNFNSTVTMAGYTSADFTVSNNLFRGGLKLNHSQKSGLDSFVVDANSFIPAGYDILNPSVVSASGAGLDMGYLYPLANSFYYDLTVTGNAFLGNTTGINLRSYPVDSLANVSGNSFYNDDAINADLIQMTISNNTVSRGNVYFATNTAVRSFPLTMDGNTFHDGMVFVGRKVDILSDSIFTNNSITNNSIYYGVGYYALMVEGNFTPVQSGNTYTVSGTRSATIPSVTTTASVRTVYIAGNSVYTAGAIINNSLIQVTSDGDAKKYGVYYSGITAGNEFTNNTVKSISAGTADSYGVYHISAGIKMRGNVIRVSNAPVIYGLWNNGTVNEFINNTIAIGSSTSGLSYGIKSIGTFSGTMSNNTIDGGIGVTGAFGYHGYITTNMLNNIFKTSMGSGGVCVYSEWNATGLNVQNTNFSNCATVWSWAGTAYTLAELEADASNLLGTASGNTNLVPAFTSSAAGDYTLTAAAACELRQGGQNLSGSFSTDAAGITRTATLNCGPANAGAAGWSMGAYEKD